MSFRRLVPSAGALALLLALAVPAAAQWGPSYAAVKGMDESFRIDVGGFFQKFETTIRYDAQNGTPGTEIGLEDVLGTPSSKTNFRVDGYLRFGRHGRLEFAYRGWNLENSTALTRDIQFGNQVYHVNAEVDTQLKVSVGELYYSYSFVNSGESELGLMLGVSSYWNRLALTATGSVSGSGGSSGSTITSESKSLVAPIPAIGAHARYTLLPGLFLYGKAKGMKASISGRSGSMVDTTAGLDFFITPNIGIGGAYEYVKINFTDSRDRFLKVNYKYSGPLVYLSLAF